MFIRSTVLVVLAARNAGGTRYVAVVVYCTVTIMTAGKNLLFRRHFGKTVRHTKATDTLHAVATGAAILASVRTAYRRANTTIAALIVPFAGCVRNGGAAASYITLEATLFITV